MRSLLLIESLDLRPSNQYIFLSESPSCLRLEEIQKIVMKHAHGGNMMKMEVKINATNLFNKPSPQHQRIKISGK
jgi:hypothetical protein